jgi:hypothetical protein
VVAGPLFGEAGLVVATMDLDVVGYYARPDVFSLHVRES